MGKLFAFDNSYARLPEGFFARVAPTPVPAPRLISLNRELAERLGLDPDALAEGAGAFVGNLVPEGAEPIAMAYAGHQFGHFVPQLGDGRAILIGEVVDPAGGRFDVQLKGAGATPFSRRGDGRAALGPVLREYLVSEAMAALGLPTTRALAAATTGAKVIREELLPGAVLTRVARSHIRVGTFQFFASRGDTASVRRLADYVIARLYPECAEAAEPYRALLDRIVSTQAELVARWLLVGFVHGVMNTDNMSIAGETIDYGPCAFLDAYDPAAVFSSIDHGGRYAYGNQPRIAHWNLTRLAECLAPLFAEDQKVAHEKAAEALSAFAGLFHSAYVEGLARKLGLSTLEEGDLELMQDLLDRMAAGKADFTLTFRRLCEAAAGPEGDAEVRVLFEDPATFDAWAAPWRARLGREPIAGEALRAALRLVNPAFIPRNHRIEEAIAAAVERDDFGPFETLKGVLATPFAERPDFAVYEKPPLGEQRVYRTFCGT